MTEEVTVPGTTILELVEYWGCTPDNETPAFVSTDANGGRRSINRREVLDLSKRFAHRLHSLGVQKGDVVCNALPNSLERVVCEFGIQFSGATSLNGQILRSDGEDFLEALRISQCVAVIVDPFVKKSAHPILLKEVPLGCESSVHSERLPHLRRLILCIRDDHNSENDFLSSLKNPDHPQFRAKVSPADLATIMTTSGSTGYSKLVKHSQASICHFSKQVKAIEPLLSGTPFINCAQLGWAGGYPQWYLSCGVSRHFIDQHDGPPADMPSLLWRIIVREKIVYGFVSPMFVNAILTQCPWQATEWKPKVLCLAGQPVKKESLSIIGKLCEAVDVNYGMTECNVVTTHRIVEPSTYVDGCGGHAGYGVQIKVVDANRQEVPRGTMGEILVRSPSLCLGFMNNEAATSAFTDDGWFCTDDAGYVGSDGKIYVEGRQSDCIHRGAYILYPGWLERKLREVSGVKDIAIVPVPDKVLHNEICACVVVDGVMGVVAGSWDGTDTQDGQSETQSHTKLNSEVDKDVLVENNLFNSNSIQSSLGSSQKESKAAESKVALVKGHIQSTAVEKYNTQPVSQKFINSQQSINREVNTNDGPCESNKNSPVHVNMNSLTDLNMQLVNTSSPRNREMEGGWAQNLTGLEQKLRSFASSISMLHESDVMRMVPKFYVFMEAFPTTSTGKISRREIRKIATAVLLLE